MESGKSGLYYPYKFARFYLLAMEDVMGRNSLNAVLKMAHLSHYADALPPDTLERAFDFADFMAINLALEELYGPRGGRGVALRAGRACFAQRMRNFGAMVGVAHPLFSTLPLDLRVRVGLHAIAGIFTRFSDQVTHVVEHNMGYNLVVEQSPACWGRSADRPVCHSIAGVIQECARWAGGGHEFWVVETKCQAVGDEQCVFTIDKKPIN